jgi:hypothetical protein
MFSRSDRTDRGTDGYSNLAYACTQHTNTKKAFHFSAQHYCWKRRRQAVRPGSPGEPASLNDYDNAIAAYHG